MSFTFNNRSCETFGLYVEHYPSRPVPEKLYNTYQVPGLSGKIFIPQGSYANVIQPYDVYVKGGTSGMQKLIADIAHWLLTPDEPKDLTDSYDTTALRKAVFIGGNDWANSLNAFGRCTLNFDCAPQRYDRVPQINTGTTPGGSSGGFTLGTGSPKGNGYIDDIIPYITFEPLTTLIVGEKLILIFRNPITSETTTLTLTDTEDMTGKQVVIDMLKGVIYVEDKLTKKQEDILSYFTVAQTGSLKMRFTYRFECDIHPENASWKHIADPRWYKL